jgi:hypothetical protein
MRALCGAIITAGAVLGLGLAAQAFAPRYLALRDSQVDPAKHPTLTEQELDERGKRLRARFHEVDAPMLYIVVFLSAVAVIGLGIAVLGLAYHQQRRHYEHLREEQRLAAQQRTPV